MTYTQEELVNALKEAGVEQGDLVMVHTGLSSLRAMPQGVRSQEEMSAFCLQALREVLGTKGTLCVPSFTYSLGAGKIYDANVTATSGIGAFPEYFWRQPGVIRSQDPFLAVAMEGPLAASLSEEKAHTSYGKNSFFDRFVRAGGKLVTIGVGIRWATIRYHFVEIAGAPFRYLKFFSGQRMLKGELKYTEWLYSVAPYAPEADKMSRQLGFMVEDMLSEMEDSPLKRAKLARGYVNCISGAAYRSFLVNLLQREPWISSDSIKSVADIIAAENERTGKEIPQADWGEKDWQSMARALTPLSRHLISDGYDGALQTLAGSFSLRIYTYETGRQAWRWIVPERYVCRKAKISTETGEILLDTEKNNLNIASYSKSFSGLVSREELLQHISTVDTAQAATWTNAVPWKSCCYNRTWQLCCSRADKERLSEKQYQVEIDTDFSFGNAKVGELTLPGKSARSVVLAAHLDGADQYNWGLSGVMAGLQLFERLKKKAEHRYTYKLLLVPGQMGLAAYLAEQGKSLDLAGILLLDMLAVPGAAHALYTGEAKAEPFTETAAAVVKETDGAARICAVSDRSWGEADNRPLEMREYNFFDGSEFSCPVLSLSRCHESGLPFPAYHTNKDTWENADFGQEEQSVLLLEKLINRWEQTDI